jgi:hypothetical protein
LPTVSLSPLSAAKGHENKPITAFEGQGFRGDARSGLLQVNNGQILLDTAQDSRKGKIKHRPNQGR